ncbi:MAG: hypothetical protein OXL40_09130 [Bacteroidota bacterium]|nr:hypothetical protein [Bacteroidota bacterium]
MMKRLHPGTTIADIIFRSNDTSLGRRLVEQSESKGVHAHRTFDADS